MLLDKKKNPKHAPRLTQRNHVAFKVDIADHFPATANAGRHLGDPVLLDPELTALVRSSETRLWFCEKHTGIKAGFTVT